MYQPLHYPPPARRSTLAEHPGAAITVLLFGGIVVMALWQVTLVLAAASLIGFGLWHLTLWSDCKQLEKTRSRQALIARAEYEHRLLMAGDRHAIYGQYPPAI